MRTRAVVALAVAASFGIALASTAVLAQGKADPALDEVLAKVGAYVAGYGEKTSVVVACENYTQNFTIDGVPMLRPRQLVAEFAIVRAGSAGWIGFRDVIEVNGDPVGDRRDRLISLLTSSSATVSEATRIANESSRFNVGPVARNFNTPTTAMFFFLPEHLARFTFTRKGTKTIDKVQTLEIGFKETRTPTFIMTRAGQDVPVDGTLWVNPADGTVIRTRIRMRNFSDQEASPELPVKPQERPQVNPNVPTGGQRAVQIQDMNLQRQESSADVEVTYRRPQGMDLWLPSRMVESYSGPIVINQRPRPGQAVTRASYTDFKQFGTTGTIVPK